ncbi:MAG: acetylserotonin O-methyltransferase [Syntrophobacterales bacterium]|jgi:SAM-dependent methyltransferase|nr:acetylserotonin O-methyltransferase [Syntrophobacterales bacterium]
MALDPEGGFDQLMAMGRGFQAAKMLMVAVDLGLFDFLDEPMSAVEIAARLQADARSTGIFLNGLAALGLLVKGVDYFRNSELAARFLVQGGDNYRGAIIKHMGHTWKRGWEDLQETILVGRPAEDPEKWVDARPQRDEGEVRAFILGMHAIARDLAPAVAAKLDLKGVRRLLDLGGGPATYAITFAQANPELKATVFDLPMPIEIAKEKIAASGLTDRVNTLPGNFLKDDIGSGYDFIWISQILHSHNKAQCKFLIGKAAAALTPGGTLAIQDFYLNADGASPTGAAMFGVHMLAVTPRGRAYTHGEVAEWMNEAGLAAPEFIQSGMDASMLVAKKQ